MTSYYGGDRAIEVFLMLYCRSRPPLQRVPQVTRQENVAWCAKQYAQTLYSQTILQTYF